MAAVTAMCFIPSPQRHRRRTVREAFCNDLVTTSHMREERWRDAWPQDSLPVSEYTALREVSNAIVARLTAAFTAEPLLNALLGMGHVISLRTPAEMLAASPQLKGLSVWLYEVSRAEFSYNRPPERIGPDLIRRAPIPITLHYLMTPLADDSTNEQLILGKVLQVFNDEPIFRVDPADPELTDEVRVALENPGMEVLSKLWSALTEPYRLCASYLAQTVNIRSGAEPGHRPPVLERIAVYEQVLSST
jgi:uncharacterized protein DUF4255